MTITLIHSIWTTLLLIIFIGIVVWSYSKKRRRMFDAAARAPLEEREEPRSLAGEPHD